MTDRLDPDLLRARISTLEAELARARAWQESEWLADPVLIHDVDGQLLAANQPAADLLGRSVAELLRHDLFALEQTLRDGDREAARENWRRLEADVPIAARGRLLPGAGPPVPVECTIVARDADGRRRIVLVARDLSDRLRVERALRDSEQRFRFLFEAAPVAMMRCQADGALVQVNRALGEWLGLDIAALPGSPARDLVLPDDRPAIDARLAALASIDDRPIALDLRLLGPDGPLWGSVTLFAEPDGRGQLRQVIGVLEDIDARVRAEARVSALLATLEGEVEARTAELRRSNRQLRVEIDERERAEALLVRARERAEAASQAKSRFLMVMSHELRTPLNAILGYTDLHIHHLDDGQPAPRDELLTDLHRVRGAGLHLLSHIDDILHMTRLDADARNDVARVELGPFMRQLAEAMRLQLARPELALSLALADELGALDTDAGKLQHILRHLLRNAAKFTPRGRLELHAAREPGGGVRVDVIDTGIGIPPGQLDLIFVPFAQGDDSPTRRHGGLGLGLALCRRYCDELGGSISVESILGRGSRFTVRLPVAPPAKLG